MLPWIPIILAGAPWAFGLLKVIFGALSLVPIVGPIFLLLSLVMPL